MVTISRPISRVPGLSTALFAALIVPLVLVAVLAWRSYERTREEVWREVDATTDLAAEHIAKVFETTELLAGQIEAQIAGPSWDELAADAVFHAQLQASDQRLPQIHGIWLSDASGTTRASSHVFPTPAVSIADRDYYRAARDTGRMHISRPLVSRHTGQPVFSVVRPLRTVDGEFDGLVSVSLDPRYFEQVFAEAVHRIRGSLVLVRVEQPGLDGDVLARFPRTDGQQRLASYSPLFSALTSPGAVRYRVSSQLDGVNRIHTGRKVGTYPLLVAAGAPLSVINKRWGKEWREIGMFAIPLYLGLIVAVLLARRHMRAERRLRDTLEARVAARTADLEKLVGEKEVLLREVHHRVKNNLQMMQSMVRLTAQRAPSESRPQFASVARRIWAIGQLYNQLYTKQDVTSIDLGHYVDSVCRNPGLFGEEANVKVECVADAIIADLDTAVPIGLIAVELITNAYKHAFPGGRAGRIAVRLACGGNGRATLTVADDGIGMRKPVRSGDDDDLSMGMKLVTALVQQVAGDLSVATGPGTRWTLVFRVKEPPAERVASAAG
jgi:two-component system, sensor histidine kinase PdtaS